VLGAAALAAALSGWADSGLRYGKWCALGVLYVGLPCLAVLWLLEDPKAGFVTLIWLMAVTWATDTGGYVAGRLIGGPKLAPRISPNKTWAGLAGGIVGALAVGLVVALWFGQGNVGAILLISGVLAIVGQGGDLFESWVKRHFGVKDASSLIPGHGGVLDRVDGLVAVSLAVAIFELWIGHSPLLP
jgi:phosphatidate cytidylyltransferase